MNPSDSFSKYVTYPQHLAGNAISVESQVLAVAEILASMSMQQELTLQRAELALRIAHYRLCQSCPEQRWTVVRRRPR